MIKDMPYLKTIKIAAWASLVLAALAVLVPIEYRPTSSLPREVERFAAFAAVGFAFALAYPRRLGLAALMVIGAALALEALQLFAPSRHGRLLDASIKAFGAAVGLAIGWVLLSWEARRARRAATGSTEVPAEVDAARDVQRSRL
jgi:VanZ family protein